jgi:cell division protein FtsB
MPSRRESRPGARPSTRAQTRPRTRRDGTPRRRTSTTAAPAADNATAKQRPAGPRSLTGRAAVVLLVIGALVVSYAQSLRVWFDQHQQISALQDEIKAREQRVGQLEDEITRWNDDAYVRAQARQRFGWVMPGEVGYRVIGPDGKPVGTPPEQAGPTPATGQQDPTWYTKLWGSVQGAGAEQKQKPPAPRKTTPPDRVLTPPPSSQPSR